MRKIREIVHQTVPFLEAGSWVGWILLAVFGLTGAAVMGWSSAQLVWFWDSYAYFGVACTWLATLILMGVSFRLVRGLYQTWSGAVGLGLIAIAVIILIAGLVLMARERATGELPPKAAKNQTTNTEPLSRIVEDENISVRDGSQVGTYILMFTAKFKERGEKLDVFFDYASVRLGVQPPVIQGIYGSLAAQRRIRITTIERYAPKQELHVNLATFTPAEAGQLILNIDGKDGASAKTGVTWAHVAGSVILLGSDGSGESYPFLILSRAIEEQKPPVPPLIVSPAFLSSLNQWGIK